MKKNYISLLFLWMTIYTVGYTQSNIESIEGIFNSKDYYNPNKITFVTFSNEEEVICIPGRGCYKGRDLEERINNHLHSNTKLFFDSLSTHKFILFNLADLKKHEKKEISFDNIICSKSLFSAILSKDVYTLLERENILSSICTDHKIEPKYIFDNGNYYVIISDTYVFYLDLLNGFLNAAASDYLYKKPQMPEIHDNVVWLGFFYNHYFKPSALISSISNNHFTSNDFETALNDYSQLSASIGFNVLSGRRSSLSFHFGVFQSTYSGSFISDSIHNFFQSTDFNNSPYQRNIYSSLYNEAWQQRDFGGIFTLGLSYAIPRRWNIHIAPHFKYIFSSETNSELLSGLYSYRGDYNQTYNGIDYSREEKDDPDFDFLENVNHANATQVIKSDKSNFALGLSAGLSYDVMRNVSIGAGLNFDHYFTKDKSAEIRISDSSKEFYSLSNYFAVMPKPDIFGWNIFVQFKVPTR